MPIDYKSDRQSQQIRAEIRCTPGARDCPHCDVITQGGRKGLAAHMNRVHPEVNYAFTE